MTTKHTLIVLLWVGLALLGGSTMVYAGNPDRAGQAGASELLINPWARSSGLHGANSSTVTGIEASRLNVAGLSFVRKTQVVFANTMWLKGSDVSINALGFAQKLGENSVLGLNMMAMGFGEVPVTTETDPEGLSGATFSPQLLNIGIAYARAFSESIHVGAQVTLVNEGIANASASGLAFDMGIQYVTGPKNNMHFGIALRNIGTPMRFKGDGLAYQLNSPQGYNFTVDQRTDKYEMPSQLNIGGAYDFYFGTKHIVSLMGNFTSNSFTKDQIGAGLEYGFNKMVMLRVGYRYEKGITGTLDSEERTTAFTGLSAGVSLEIPFKEDGPSIGVDYGFRATNPYDNTHTIGVRINL